MTYVLDTDTVSLFRDGFTTVVTNVLSHPPQNVFATAISLEEQLSGWYTYLRKAKTPEHMERAYDELIATTRFYGSIRILSFPKPAVECFH